MPFITQSNLRSILRKVELSKAELNGKIYKWPIDFFSRFEQNKLLAFRLLCENEESFLTEVYEKFAVEVDTETWVFECIPHAYHLIGDCASLSNNYLNIKIPVEFKTASGHNSRVSEFRSWVKQNIDLLKENRQDFFGKMSLRFRIEISPEMMVEYANSGSEIKKNYNLSELEKDLDKLIGEAYTFFDEQNIPSYFGSYTYGAQIDKLPSNAPRHDVLIEFLNRFKNPITDLLKEWYRVSLNPNLEFDGLVLEKLGFKKCSRCNQQAYLEFRQKS